MTWLHGLDVSVCQGKIDWALVPESERFVVCKISEGTSLDPLGAINVEGARESGRIVGAYAFGRPSPGKAREHFRKLWDGFGDTMPDLPLVLDLETTGGLSGQAVVDYAAEWDAEREVFTAVTPLLYTGAYFLEQLHADLSPLHHLPLWLAQYSHRGAWTPVEGKNTPRVPEGWETWAMWQYSGDGGQRVAGIHADVDRNVFNGTEPDLRRLCGQPDAGV